MPDEAELYMVSDCDIIAKDVESGMCFYCCIAKRKIEYPFLIDWIGGYMKVGSSLNHPLITHPPPISSTDFFET